MVVMQPQFTRVEEPTLLCNHVLFRPIHLYGNRVYQASSLTDGGSIPFAIYIGSVKAQDYYVLVTSSE